MRFLRPASSSLTFFACVLLTLVLHPDSSAKSNNNLIHVWIVGSPYSGALPPEVVPREFSQRAESLGYKIEVESFRASGFAARFRQAIQDHHEPEILTFDNFGVISGVNTSTGWIEGVDSDRQGASSLALVHESMTSLQSRGWVMLVRSAVNYDAARALAKREPQCEGQSIDPALREAEEKAVLATRAYIECDRSTLSSISDDSRMVQQCFLPQSDSKIESVKACRVSGNQKLAFVSLVTNFSAQTREPNAIFQLRHGMDLGQQSILAVLRNQSGTWRVLAITHDPMNTVGRNSRTSSYAFADKLDQEQLPGVTPEIAQLLTPDGIYPRPPRGERFGDFAWTPSHSSDVIGQVVEFMWAKDTNWGLTRLFFLPANESKLSSGYLMSGGTTVWRVWSINKAGDVVFSEQRTFRN
jgi:hypothetical protein